MTTNTIDLLYNKISCLIFKPSIISIYVRMSYEDIIHIVFYVIDLCFYSIIWKNEKGNV